MSDHATEADIALAIFLLPARHASRPSSTADLFKRAFVRICLFSAKIVHVRVGISGGVKNFKIDKSLMVLVGLPGLEPGTRPL